MHKHSSIYPELCEKREAKRLAFINRMVAVTLFAIIAGYSLFEIVRTM